MISSSTVSLSPVPNSLAEINICKIPAEHQEISETHTVYAAESHGEYEYCNRKECKNVQRYMIQHDQPCFCEISEQDKWRVNLIKGIKWF